MSAVSRKASAFFKKKWGVFTAALFAIAAIIATTIIAWPFKVEVAHAEDLTFDSGMTVNVSADGATISGTGVTVQVVKSKPHGDPAITLPNGQVSWYVAKVTMPDGQVLTGYCYESWTNQAGHQYIWPPEGGSNLSFTCTKNGADPKGGAKYDCIIDTSKNGSHGRQQKTFAAGWIPQTDGSFTLYKNSAKPEYTDGNYAYTLQGITYGVFADPECRNQVASMTLDKNGMGQASKLSPGTYYVKELTTTEGYVLNNTVYTVTINPGQMTVLGTPHEGGEGTGPVIVKPGDPASPYYSGEDLKRLVLTVDGAPLNQPDSTGQNITFDYKTVTYSLPTSTTKHDVKFTAASVKVLTDAGWTYKTEKYDTAVGMNQTFMFVSPDGMFTRTYTVQWLYQDVDDPLS